MGILASRHHGGSGGHLPQHLNNAEDEIPMASSKGKFFCNAGKNITRKSVLGGIFGPAGSQSIF